MSASVVLTELADADIAAIYDHLREAAGTSVARRYRVAFRRLYDRLADYPDVGSPRSNLGVDIRIALVSPYVVVYRHDPADRVVVILRIMHGYRKISGQMLR